MTSAALKAALDARHDFSKASKALGARSAHEFDLQGSCSSLLDRIFATSSPSSLVLPYVQLRLAEEGASEARVNNVLRGVKSAFVRRWSAYLCQDLDTIDAHRAVIEWISDHAREELGASILDPQNASSVMDTGVKVPTRFEKHLRNPESHSQIPLQNEIASPGSYGLKDGKSKDTRSTTEKASASATVGSQEPKEKRNHPKSSDSADVAVLNGTFRVNGDSVHSSSPVVERSDAPVRFKLNWGVPESWDRDWRAAASSSAPALAGLRDKLAHFKDNNAGAGPAGEDADRCRRKERRARKEQENEEKVVKGKVEERQKEHSREERAEKEKREEQAAGQRQTEKEKEKEKEEEEGEDVKAEDKPGDEGTEIGRLTQKDRNYEDELSIFGQADAEDLATRDEDGLFDNDFPPQAATPPVEGNFVPVRAASTNSLRNSDFKLDSQYSMLVAESGCDKQQNKHPLPNEPEKPTTTVETSDHLPGDTKKDMENSAVNAQCSPNKTGSCDSVEDLIDLRTVDEKSSRGSQTNRPDLNSVHDDVAVISMPQRQAEPSRVAGKEAQNVEATWARSYDNWSNTKDIFGRANDDWEQTEWGWKPFPSASDPPAARNRSKPIEEGQVSRSRGGEASPSKPYSRAHQDASGRSSTPVFDLICGTDQKFALKDRLEILSRINLVLHERFQNCNVGHFVPRLPFPNI